MPKHNQEADAAIAAEEVLEVCLAHFIMSTFIHKYPAVDLIGYMNKLEHEATVKLANSDVCGRYVDCSSLNTLKLDNPGHVATALAFIKFYAKPGQVASVREMETILYAERKNWTGKDVRETCNLLIRTKPSFLCRYYKRIILAMCVCCVTVAGLCFV